MVIAVEGKTGNRCHILLVPAGHVDQQPIQASFCLRGSSERMLPCGFPTQFYGPLRDPFCKGSVVAGHLKTWVHFVPEVVAQHRGLDHFGDDLEYCWVLSLIRTTILSCPVEGQFGVQENLLSVKVM